MAAMARWMAGGVLVADGGTGTALLDGTGGGVRWPDAASLARLPLAAPGRVAAVHDAFLAAGCDVVTTHTFGLVAAVTAGTLSLSEAASLARAAARIARARADRRRAADGRRRLVAGSVGPPHRPPVIGRPPPRGTRLATRVVARGLLAEGCDLLLLETCQGGGMARLALRTCRVLLARETRDVPVGVLFAVGDDGRLGDGTDPVAAARFLLPLRPDLLGANCGPGPEAVLAAARRLAHRLGGPVAALPATGVPPGPMVSPDRFAALVAGETRRSRLRLVGGCCGAGPAHVAALVRRLRGRHGPNGGTTGRSPGGG